MLIIRIINRRRSGAFTLTFEHINHCNLVLFEYFIGDFIVMRTEISLEIRADSGLLYCCVSRNTSTQSTIDYINKPKQSTGDRETI